MHISQYWYNSHFPSRSETKMKILTYLIVYYTNFKLSVVSKILSYSSFLSRKKKQKTNKSWLSDPGVSVIQLNVLPFVYIFFLDHQSQLISPMTFTTGVKIDLQLSGAFWKYGKIGWNSRKLHLALFLLHRGKWHIICCHCAIQHWPNLITQDCEVPTDFQV